MMRNQPGSPRRGVVVAMVLGTALSAFGSTADAASQPQSLMDLSRYCNACWRNARLPADAWSDCTQDVFARLLERVPTQAWDRVLRAEGEERREFLRAIDAVKKRHQRARRCACLVDDAVADSRTQPARQLADEREAVEHTASRVLSPRQQRLLQLTSEGWSVHEIASQLRMSPERVSDEKYKAIHKLRHQLA